jgi:hypothetical protein
MAAENRTMDGPWGFLPFRVAFAGIIQRAAFAGQVPREIQLYCSESWFSRMRLTVAVVVAALTFVCGQRPATAPAPDILAMRFGVSSKIPGLEGVYCTPAEIGMFSGTILELKAGKFRYWFYSDVGGGDTPQYPLAGDYSERNGVLHLTHELVYQREWFPDVVNGIPVLWRADARKAWHKDKKVYDYGVLLKTEEQGKCDWDIARPSVKDLYQADKRRQEWKDPFVYGPQ